MTKVIENDSFLMKADGFVVAWHKFDYGGWEAPVNNIIDRVINVVKIFLRNIFYCSAYWPFSYCEWALKNGSELDGRVDVVQI